LSNPQKFKKTQKDILPVPDWMVKMRQLMHM